MNSDGTSGDIGKIVSDMKEVAELGLQENPPVRFAYEALSWGAHLDLYDHRISPLFFTEKTDGNKSGTSF